MSKSETSKHSTGKTKVASNYIYLFHESTGKAIRLFEGLVLGRSDGNENYPADSLMSRRHCRFSYDSKTGKVFLTDLQSTNGTRINGIMLPQKPVPFRTNEVLEMGNQRFMLTDSQKRNPFFENAPRESLESRPGKLRSKSEAQVEEHPKSLSERALEMATPSNWSPIFSVVATLIGFFALLAYFGFSMRIGQIAHPTVNLHALRSGLRHTFFYPAFISIVIAFIWINLQTKSFLGRMIGFFGSGAIYVTLGMVWTLASGIIFQIEAQRVNSACFEGISHTSCATIAVDVFTGRPGPYSELVLKRLPRQRGAQMGQMLREWSTPRGTNDKLAALTSTQE